MHRHRQLAPRRGFTLIELLVVIGIIVLLIGLLLTGLVHARKSAARTRTTADLALIGTALEAYKLDFGDYPRFPTAADDAASTAAGTADSGASWLDSRQDRGAVLLCRCLLGPGPAGTATNPAPATDAGADGADGFGFRATRNITTYGTNEKFVGKIYGPYVQSDKFPVGGTKDADNYRDAVLLDTYGNPILYYPALPTHGPLTTTGAYVTSANPTSPPTQTPLYNAFDNQGLGTTATPPYLAVSTMQTILGADSTGEVPSGGTPVTTVPYILWTAGPDGIYGFDANNKTDDITNFDVPGNLLK